MVNPSRALHDLRAHAITVAYRSENGIRDGLARLAVRRGWTPAVLPYSGYSSRRHARVLARIVLAPASVDPAARRGIAAWRRLLTLESPATEVEIAFAGATTVATSDDAGIVDARVPVDVPPEPGAATALLRVPGRPATAVPVHVVDPEATRGVICDVDDTVWITGLAHPIRAARRTLLSTSSTRRSVPGMAALVHEALRGQRDAATVYLSNGPWNLAGVVLRFLDARGFPPGAILMTDWGITPRRWFRDGKEHKSSALVRLREDLPEVSWVLIGDDGEHDPDLYADFAGRHPDRVAAIALRQVAPGLGRTAERDTTAGGVPVVLGADGDALLPLLREALTGGGARTVA